jgi:hypothetical protein
MFVHNSLKSHASHARRQSLWHTEMSAWKGPIIFFFRIHVTGDENIHGIVTAAVIRKHIKCDICSTHRQTTPLVYIQAQVENMSTTKALRTITNKNLFLHRKFVYLCVTPSKNMFIYRPTLTIFIVEATSAKTNERCVTPTLTARWVWCPNNEKPFDLNHINTTLHWIPSPLISYTNRSHLLPTSTPMFLWRTQQQRHD